MSNLPQNILAAIDWETFTLKGRPQVTRRLSDLKGVFADARAYEEALQEGDPVLYTVSSLDDHNGDGQLHLGLGVLYPGKVGDEYYLTKGHLHSVREAAEVYICLRGEGLMLLEDERTGEAWSAPLDMSHAVYVPGYTAHRTVNTGSEPLVYFGVYPFNAGHDYGAIAEKNFKQVVVERNGAPQIIDRRPQSQSPGN